MKVRISVNEGDGSTMSNSRNSVFRLAKCNRYIIILMVMIVSYVFYWSTITILKFYALNQTVFDTGLFMESNFLVYNTHWSILSFIYSIPNQGIRFIIFPISFPKNYPLILIFQSAIIGGASFPIYLISKLMLKRENYAIIIAICYLLYFPLSGINWFSVHFQAFFPFLFFWGYYFYITKRFSASYFFFFLSGIVKYPFELFILVFVVYEIIRILSEQRYKKSKLDSQFIMLLFLMLAMVMLLYIGNFSSGSVASSTGLYINSASEPVEYFLRSKILTIMLLYSPFLFIPFLSKKWTIFNLVIVLTILVTTNGNYFYPSLFQLQYSSFMVTFIFLGFVDELCNILSKELKPNKKNKWKFTWLTHNLKIEKSIVIFSVLLIIILALFFQPYGPINRITRDNFNLSNEDNVNFTIYSDVNKLVSLIPQYSYKYVLFQSNLIQLLPSPFAYDNTPLTGGLSSNLSMQVSNGSWVKPNIEYIIVDPYSIMFTEKFGNSMSMEQTVNKLINTTKYGVYAELDGIILFKENYNSTPVEFSPITVKENSTCFYDYISQTKGVFPQIFSNISLPAAFYAFFLSLPPGHYSAEFYMSTNNFSANNYITINAISQKYLFSKEISGESFKEANTKTGFYLNFTTSQFSNFQFRGMNISWAGSLMFYGFSLIQLSNIS